MITISRWIQSIEYAESLKHFLFPEMEVGPFIHYISWCFQNVLLAPCAWPSDSRGKWKPTLCRGAPSVPSLKSYYQCCYANPVTPNPIHAERNRRCLPATVQLQRSSLMGGLALKGQEGWHWWHWCGTKWRGSRAEEEWWVRVGVRSASNYLHLNTRVRNYNTSCWWHTGKDGGDWQAVMGHEGARGQINHWDM